MTEDLFDDLRQRGVKEVSLWITDGGQGILNALEAKFPGIPRQRCINIYGECPELPPQATPRGSPT